MVNLSTNHDDHIVHFKTISMKTIITISILFFLFNPLHTQLKFSKLANSEITVNISNGNFLFTSADGHAGYTLTPLGEISPATTFTSSMWLGALDPAGNLILSADAYNNSVVSTKSGPIDMNTGDIYQGLEEVFDRFFETSQFDINKLQEDLEDGILDEEVPQSLKEWPALGNPYFEDIFGYALPVEPGVGFAPFFDVNANGLYEPQLGDYPEIKGAHQAIFYIYSFLETNQTQSPPIETEVRVLARIYEDVSSNIKRTVFFDYELRQAQLFQLNDYYISMFIDPDLGCFTDDYMGYNQDCEFAYVYNQDVMDGDSGCQCPANISTFCEDPPIMAYAFLNKPTIDGNPNSDEIETSGFMTFNASNPTTDLPTIGEQFYNLMKNSWADGTPLTYGGNGYNPGSEDFTNYCFPGNPSIDDEWSMCSEDQPQIDRRGLLNMGPFDLPPGAVVRFSFAAFSIFDVDLPCPDIEETISTVCDEIKDFEGSVSSSVSDIHDQAVQCDGMEVQQKGGLIQLTSIENDGFNYVELYELNGKLLRRVKLSKDNTVELESPLNSGIYVLRLVGNDNNYCSRKIYLRQN